MTDIRYTYYESPLGNTLLAADERGLRLISFAAGKRPERPESSWRKDTAPFNETIRQLRAYFAGELRDFDPAALASRHRFSTSRLANASDNSLRRNHLLWPAGPPAWKSKRLESRGLGKRIESDSHHRPVPSRHRQQRQPGRLWRRPSKQKGPARPRKPAAPFACIRN